MDTKIERSEQREFPGHIQTNAIELELTQYRQQLLTFMNPEEMEKVMGEYARLLEGLSFIKEDVLFISIGCASLSPSSGQEQRFPTYIKNIAKEEKIRVLLIDGLFGESKYKEGFERDPHVKKAADSSYEHKDHSNLGIELFGCYLLPNGKFSTLLKEVIGQVLDKGGKVFIANHTQAWSFEDIPSVADACNMVKTSHPLGGTNLQFYTQGGMGKVRYYLDKTCDCARDACGSGHQFEPEHEEFYVCSELQDLAKVKQFQPRVQALKEEHKLTQVEESSRRQVGEAGVRFTGILTEAGLFATGANKNRQATSDEDSFNESLAATPSPSSKQRGT